MLCSPLRTLGRFYVRAEGAILGGIMKVTAIPQDSCDRRDVADEIEIEFVVERRVDRVRRACQEQRVAVRRRLHDRLGTDIAGGTRSVLDDEWLAEALRQPLTHQARDGVSWAAGGKAHNDPHRPRWVDLRPRDAGHGRER